MTLLTITTRLADKKRVTEITGFSAPHIARLEAQGKFPKRLRLGPNKVRWREDELLVWLQEKDEARHRKDESGDDAAVAQQRENTEPTAG